MMSIRVTCSARGHARLGINATALASQAFLRGFQDLRTKVNSEVSPNGKGKNTFWGNGKKGGSTYLERTEE